MGTIRIEEVKTRKQEKDFIRLPWSIYKGDPCWVPTLVSDFKKTIRGENNTLKKSGPYELILAYKGETACGRLCVGINEDLNKVKNYKEGYIAFFESINDIEIGRSLFDYASEWLKSRGMDKIIGPLSVPNGDDYRGVLIDNFSDPTLIMNTYNKDYYQKLFEEYGFDKYWDCYAYHYDITKGIDERYRKMVPYAMDKYGFKVDKIDLKNIHKEIMDVKEILDKAMPEEWDDFTPPNDEEVKLIADHLVPVADPELIYIARTLDGKPIGFNIALPDYNQALKHMNGKLLPFGIFKFLYHKRKIDRVRLFVLFVTPEYRKKGVAGAIYLNVYDAAVKKGYKFGEGSTIWEYNSVMMRDIEKLGGEIYKTYRIYKKNI